MGIYLFFPEDIFYVFVGNSQIFINYISHLRRIFVPIYTPNTVPRA